MVIGGGGSLGGDQGARWERRAYKRKFSYTSELSRAIDKSDVFDFYHKNYRKKRMRGLRTLQPDFYYNYLMLMRPTPGTDTNHKKKKPDADAEAKNNPDNAYEIPQCDFLDCMPSGM